MTARGSVRRRRRRWPMLAILLSCTVAWVGWSPSFRVQTVEVRGTSTLCPDDVRRAAAVHPGTHLWFGIDSQQLANQVLSRLPTIDQAAVSRAFPGRVVVAVSESRSIARVLTSGGEVPVSSRGIVLAGEGGNLPFLLLPVILSSLAVGHALPVDASALLEVAVELQRLDIEGIRQLEQSEDGAIWLTTHDELAIKVGPVDGELAERLAPLPYLLLDVRGSGLQVEYVDISCPGRPALKMRSDDDDE